MQLDRPVLIDVPVGRMPRPNFLLAAARAGEIPEVGYAVFSFGSRA
jgi:hypothetical protein